MNKDLPKCVWLPTEVPNKSHNGVHRVVGSHQEFPDYLSEAADVYDTACGEEFETWAISPSPLCCTGTRAEAEKSGIFFCPICFLCFKEGNKTSTAL